jgi:hypothetical protein
MVRRFFRPFSPLGQTRPRAAEADLGLIWAERSWANLASHGQRAVEPAWHQEQLNKGTECTERSDSGTTEIERWCSKSVVRQRGAVARLVGGS